MLDAFSFLAVMIAVIFLTITPEVLPRLMETLEKVGWVSATILAIISAYSLTIGAIPRPYNFLVFVMAIALIVLSFAWSRFGRRTTPTSPIRRPLIRRRDRFLSRFERRQTAKDKNFWSTVAYGFLMGAFTVVFAYVLIAGANSYPTTVPTSARNGTIAGGAAMIALGIFLFSFAGLRTVAEVAAIRRRDAEAQYQKSVVWQRKSEYLKDELDAFSLAKDQNERDGAFTRLSAQLGNLETNEGGAWPPSVRETLLEMLTLIKTNFPTADVGYRMRAASLLRLAYTKRDPEVNSTMVKQFTDTFERIVEPQLDSALDVLLLRQELHNFEADFMMKLSDQAINDWDDGRFNRTYRNIRFDQMKSRDPDALTKIKTHLRDIWKDPKKSDGIQRRAFQLLELAKEVEGLGS